MRSILDLVSRIKITFLQAEEQKYFFFEPKGEATVSLGYDNNGNKNSFMEFHYQILTSLLFFLLDISSCGFFFFFLPFIHCCYLTRTILKSFHIQVSSDFFTPYSPMF